MHMSLPGLIIICATVLAVVLALFLPLPRSRGNAGGLVDRRPDFINLREDERYWYAGFFYVNPDDPALFVPKRLGLGWTLNLGHPQSKLALLLLSVALLLPVVVLILNFLLTGTPPSSVGCHTIGC